MHTHLMKAGAAALLAPLLAAAASSAPSLPPAADAASGPGIAGAPAPQRSPLTLERALALALAAAPGLHAAAQNAEAATALAAQAGLRPNPELSVLQEGSARGQRTQSVQLVQRLELGGKRAARSTAAQADQRVAQSELALAAGQLRGEVTAAYFDALIAQERAQLAAASLTLAQRASRAAARRLAAGRISPLEQSRARVAEAQAQLEAAQAQTEVALAHGRLAVLCGGGVRWELQAPALPQALPDYAALRRQVELGPELQLARAQVGRAEARARLEHTLRVPDVSLTLGSKRDAEAGRSQLLAGISVPLPLFNRNQGNELAALRQADQARSLQESARMRALQALDEAWQRAALAQSEIAGIEGEILPAAQQAYDAAVHGFEAGKFSFLDVLDAQRTLFQARAQRMRAMAERYRFAAFAARYLAPQEP